MTYIYLVVSDIYSHHEAKQNDFNYYLYYTMYLMMMMNQPIQNSCMASDDP